MHSTYNTNHQKSHAEFASHNFNETPTNQLTNADFDQVIQELKIRGNATNPRVHVTVNDMRNLQHQSLFQAGRIAFNSAPPMMLYQGVVVAGGNLFLTYSGHAHLASSTTQLLSQSVIAALLVTSTFSLCDTLSDQRFPRMTRSDNEYTKLVKELFALGLYINSQILSCMFLNRLNLFETTTVQASFDAAATGFSLATIFDLLMEELNTFRNNAP